MKIFIDSNIPVYLFDQDAPQKQRMARHLIDIHGSSGEIILSTQVLQEFYVSVTRKLGTPLKPEMALEATRKLATLPTIQIDTEMVLAAIALAHADKLSFWDALIIESALKGDADKLLSEDLQHGRVIHGMRIENPFLIANE